MAKKKSLTKDMLSSIREGRFYRVKQLVEQYGVFHEQSWGDGYILLRESLEHKQPGIAKFLIKHFAKPNSKNTAVSNSPLHFAVKNDYADIVELLLEKGAYPLAQGNPGLAALHIAVENENAKIVEILLNKGAYVNVTCTLPYRFRYTPLHFAVEKCNVMIAELLLASEQVDVDATGSDGLTPLHIAVEKNSLPLVDLLLYKNANVNATGQNGVTPLHIAAEVGNLKIAERLLKRGADVNAMYNEESVARNGYYPLHLAIIRKHDKMVELLLKNGAKIFDRDNKPMVSFAVAKNSLIIVEHLLSYYPDVRGHRLAVEEETKIKAEKLPSYGFNVKTEKICSYLTEDDIEKLIDCYEAEDVPDPKRCRLDESEEEDNFQQEEQEPVRITGILKLEPENHPEFDQSDIVKVDQSDQEIGQLKGSSESEKVDEKDPSVQLGPDSFSNQVDVDDKELANPKDIEQPAKDEKTDQVQLKNPDQEF